MAHCYGVNQKNLGLFIQEPRPTAYQVERHKFDKILLDNAIQNGVIVKKRCKVLNVLKNNNRITGVNYKDVNGNLNQAYASYTIDASGHSSPVYHNVGKRIYSDFFQNIAIYGYYENGKRLPTPNENNILCAAFKHGWIWYIPLSSELTSVGVVIDRNALEKGIDLKHTYENWILSCPMVADLLADANRSTKKIYSQLRVRKDFSYTNTNLWTHGMALIGDAACFVDPLFSSGVHLSTLSALFVARSVNTYLKGTFDEETCFKEFEKRYRNEYSNFYNYLVAFYDFDQTENDYYWAARKILNTDEANNEAFIKIVSGYSTQGVKSSSEINRYFEDRAGFGKSLESFYVNKQQDISSNDNINIDKFMQGFTKEIVSVQAEAAGLNIPQESEGSLISSDDHLHWC